MQAEEKKTVFYYSDNFQLLMEGQKMPNICIALFSEHVPKKYANRK